MRSSKHHKTRAALAVGVLLVAAGLFTACSLIVAKEREGAVCGNDVCETGENVQNCGNDCKMDHCGDAICQAYENEQTCPDDCGPKDCGNGEIDLGEFCDTTNLNGKSCHSLGFGGGSLGCMPNCEFDVSGCNPPIGLADGAPCVDGIECQGNTCWSGMINGYDFVGGYCTGECYMNVCPGGGVCMFDGPGGGEPYCYKLCNDPGDCPRNNYNCYVPIAQGPKICWPPHP